MAAGYTDLTGWNWTRLIERIDLEPRRHPCRRRGSAQNRILPSCARSRCSSPKARPSRLPARTRPSQNKAQGRVPEAGDLLQPQGGPGDHWRLEGPLQACAASLVVGLPTTRTYDTGGHRIAATHILDHALDSQCACFKIPVRSRRADRIRLATPCPKMPALGSSRSSWLDSARSGHH